MKAIELRAALIEANNVNLNGADALEETSVLKQLIESCKARVEELDEDAKALAEAELAALGAKKGKFEHKGKYYQLQVDETFDFAEKKAQYNDAIAAQWRTKAEEQKGLKASVSALTSEMKGLLKSWRLQHPKRVPDSISYTFKVLKKKGDKKK